MLSAVDDWIKYIFAACFSPSFNFNVIGSIVFYVVWRVFRIAFNIMALRKGRNRNLFLNVSPLSLHWKHRPVSEGLIRIVFLYLKRKQNGSMNLTFCFVKNYNRDMSKIESPAQMSEITALIHYPQNVWIFVINSVSVFMVTNHSILKFTKSTELSGIMMP